MANNRTKRNIGSAIKLAKQYNVTLQELKDTEWIIINNGEMSPWKK